MYQSSPLGLCSLTTSSLLCISSFQLGKLHVAGFQTLFQPTTTIHLWTMLHNARSPSQTCRSCKYSPAHISEENSKQSSAQDKQGCVHATPLVPWFSQQVVGNCSSNTVFKLLLVYRIIVCVPIPQKCHKRLRQKLLKSRYITATTPPNPFSSFYPPDSQKLIKNFVPIL